MKSNLPKHRGLSAAVALALAGLAAVPTLARADGVNKNCPEESVYYDPRNGGITPAQDSADIVRRSAEQVRDVDAVGHQPAGLDKITIGVDRWNA